MTRMCPPLDTTTLVLGCAALALATVACLKHLGLPMLGAKAGFQILAFVLPGMVVALLSTQAGVVALPTRLE